MQLQETILFLAVAALASALIVVLVGPRWRGLRPREPGRVGATRKGVERTHHPAPATGNAVTEPAGSGSVPSVAAIATATASSSPSTSPSSPGIPAAAPHAAPPLVHMICPTCRRQFAAGLRYCPYDARVLTADLHQPGRPMPPATAASMTNAGKICPSCARRYDTVALVCGRDGTALVSVN